jgi:murein DD-endopeptidase MepM/ murein hydrolase activator NlpD
MAQERERKKGRLLGNWKNKYRLVFMNDETLEERFTFRLSRLNVFIALGTLTIVLIVLTSVLIAYTPLREYIPGYTNVGLQKKLYRLMLRTDSIERDMARKDLFIQNLRDVINGKDLGQEAAVTAPPAKQYSNIKLKRSAEDSLLRMDVENTGKYTLYRMEGAEKSSGKRSNLGNILFFSPLKGIIINDFNRSERHYGVDIASQKNETIKSVLDGTVLFSTWTLETGYVIAIQHQQNLVSFYKHNSANLKRAGDFVKAGDPVAIVGESGELKTGPHLHFELWNDGTPVNPKDYITF